MTPPRAILLELARLGATGHGGATLAFALDRCDRPSQRRTKYWPYLTNTPPERRRIARGVEAFLRVYDRR